MKPDNHRLFRPDIVLCIALSFVLLVAGCAPITPLPGGGASIPAPSSSGGSSSGGSPSSGGSSGGGASSSSGGGLPGGGLPGGGLPGGGESGGGESGGAEPGGSGTVPGGSGEGQGSQTDPTWELPENSSGDGGWQTSNDIPDASNGEGDGADEGNTAASERGSGGGEYGNSEENPGDVDAELEGALEDLDGEILAEREIIRTSSNAPGGEIPAAGDSGGTDGEAQTGGILAPRSIPSAPPPPRRGSEGMPDDIPDAKDDDIIARQLREAAMQEQDPELKEKLWEEYRKYKKG